MGDPRLAIQGWGQFRRLRRLESVLCGLLDESLREPVTHPASGPIRCRTMNASTHPGVRTVGTALLLTFLVSIVTAASASAGIGLTRQEALKDAEQVVRGYFPKAWKQNEENLHCQKHGKPVSCPPLIFYKKVSPEEIVILYSLVVSEHPYREISGNVSIHADPSSSTGFYFKAERCKGFHCYVLGGK